MTESIDPDVHPIWSETQLRYCPKCGRETDHEPATFEYRVTCPTHGQLLLR